jgi:hydrolase, NUDIX family
MKCFWFVFCKTDIVLEKTTGGYTIPLLDDCPTPLKEWSQVLEIGTMPDDGTPIKAVSIDMPLTDSPIFEMCGLRNSYYKLSKALYLMAGKCYELLYWNQNTRFCGVCGTPIKLHTNISKRCPNCGKEVWPQVSPAVIVLVHRADEILLVRANSFRDNHYGLVAGFVETGETLEEAVHREVFEETGIRINNLRYFASQPWPYPSGVMVGYNADYVEGEIHLQWSELCKGSWFTKDNLPNLPENLSIARRLIDNWLEQMNSNKQ